FSSGNELTSADVVYTFQRAVNIPKDPASWLITQMGITADNVDQAVTAPDPYTVKIDLPQPFSPGAFLAVMANPVVGIVDSQTVKAHEKDGDWGSGWLFDNSAGSGPYVLKQWTKDDRMEFVPNPNYAGDAPKTKHVIWLNVPDTATRLQMLQAGNADIAEGLSFTQVESMKGNPDFTIYKQPDQSMVYLGMGVNTVPAFQKKEVRQAVKYAIDYEGIVNQLLHGFAEPLQGIIPAGVFGYSDKIYFQRDVDKAKSLLQQAGYGDGFTVDMLTPVGSVAGGVPAAALANILKDNLADIGITANIVQLESGELYTKYRGHEAQLVIAQWGMDYPDPQDFAGPFAEYSQQSLIWRLQDNDPELEELGNRAATMQNTPERQALYDQLNQMEADQGPFALMYQPDQVYVYRSTLKNFTWD
ncbi:MAG: ABC transporter substrate-binding protein, partial [Dactylosporangium sp.]|nr:ABC transporter substrate-binding protein [Dactylosporangium sp.]